METNATDFLLELWVRFIQAHGNESASIDNDNDSTSVIFTYKGKEFLISSRDIKEVDA